MNNRTLIRLVAVLLALIGIAYFSGVFDSNPSTLEVPDLSVNRDDVEAFEVSSPRFQISLSREGGRWVIDGTGYPADSLTVRTFLDDFEDLDVESVVTRSPERYARYGVDSLAPSVRLRTDTDDHEFVVAQDGPDRMSGYIRTYDDDRVFTAMPRIFVPMTMDRWRDKDIYRARPETVSRIGFDTPDASYALVRSDDGWMLQHGGRAQPADSLRTQQMLRELNPFRVEGFLEELDDSADETHTLTVRRTDGSTWAISLRPQNGARAVRVHGDAGSSGDMYRVLSTRVSRLFPDPDQLAARE